MFSRNIDLKMVLITKGYLKMAQAEEEGMKEEDVFCCCCREDEEKQEPTEVERSWPPSPRIYCPCYQLLSSTLPITTSTTRVSGGIVKGSVGRN